MKGLSPSPPNFRKTLTDQLSRSLFVLTDGCEILSLELCTICLESIMVHEIRNEFLLLNITLGPSILLRNLFEDITPVSDSLCTHGLRTNNRSPVGNLNVLIAKLFKSRGRTEVSRETAGGKSKDWGNLASFNIL